MNVLFLTLSRISTLNDAGIYTDLLRQFALHGDNVYVVRPTERRFGESTHLIHENSTTILAIRTLNIQKTNIVEKGIATILLGWQYRRAIANYFSGVHFDLVLYSTPPITFNGIVRHIKQRDGALSYLLLKDIFPQNAVDLSMFSKQSLFYRYFRHKEKQLYMVSDYIGCMSPANVAYTLRNNTFIDPYKVEVCPNSIEICREPEVDKKTIRIKYKLPLDKRIFVYGGNLGKPQGIDFLIEALISNTSNNDAFFLIVGGGTEYTKLAGWFDTYKPTNARLIASLPAAEYENLMSACDVGMILLDKRFTIPNYPSRLLSYLKRSMPILLATDANTDIGKIAVENGYGLWSESGDVDHFNANLIKFIQMPDNELSAMGNRGFSFLVDNYDVKTSYQTIVNHINK